MSRRLVLIQQLKDFIEISAISFIMWVFIVTEYCRIPNFNRILRFPGAAFSKTTISHDVWGHTSKIIYRRDGNVFSYKLLLLFGLNSKFWPRDPMGQLLVVGVSMIRTYLLQYSPGVHLSFYGAISICLWLSSIFSSSPMASRKLWSLISFFDR